MVSLYEKYRPKQFDEVVGQGKTMKRLLCLQHTCGLDGQVLWLTGESGVGKTTIARLVADLVAEPCMTYEIDAQDLSMDTIREWESKAQFRSLYGGYCFIVNESHGLSNKAVSRLQTTLEDRGVQQNSTWVFTTTNAGEQKLFGDKFDACPFLSRAVCFELSHDSSTMLAMAGRLMMIAEEEHIDGTAPMFKYVALLKNCKGNMRSALQRIAAGEFLE